MVINWPDQLPPGGTGNVLTGHGTYWNGVEGFPADGIMRVPEGTALTLPRHNVKLPDVAGKLMEQGDWERLGTLMDIDPRMAESLEGMTTMLPGANVRKYTLTKPDSRVNVMENSVSVDGNVNLDAILKPDQGCVSWAACTVDYFGAN
ncbi:putative adhesin [Marinobacter lacisalsi]|uniref:Adhesin n=1 Tax=Marinobacter lacisalsi TaxID=475979 RepID=A0ABV8QJF9_9GAMM